MRTELQLPELGTIVCEESWWTGKKKISVNGVPLMRVQKKIFIYQTPEKAITFEFSGSFITGAKLLIDHVPHQLTTAPKWYEWMLAILILTVNIVWGNSTYLCSIFPIVGGALGGFVCGIMGMFSLVVMKEIKNPLLKIGTWILMLAATMLICYVLAIFILSAIA